MLCPRNKGPTLVAFLLTLTALAAPTLSAAQPRPDAGTPLATPDAGTPLATPDAGTPLATLDAGVGTTLVAPDSGLPPVVLPPQVDGQLTVETPPSTPPLPLPRCLVIDAAPYGVDPVVGQYVSQTMRATALELGYSVLTPEESVAAARRVRMPYPPAPADLWRATWSAQAARGAFARVWAYRGQYVVELTVASADGGGPFFARASASAQELVATVARLTREAMPPPGITTAPSAQTAPGTPPTAAPGTPGVVEPATPARRRRRGRARRWVLAVQTDLAFGASRDFFFNALLGARIDYRITPDIRLGAYVGYANLRGKDGRANNLLVLAQIEDRIRISSGTDIRVPLRLGIGYLPGNGPVVRLAAGIGFPITNRLEMTFDILAPTFWVIPGRTVVSLNLAVELGYRF